MQKVFKLSFKTRLLIGFAVIIVAEIVVLLVAINSLLHLERIQQQVSQSYQVTGMLANYRADNTRVRTLLLEVVNPKTENPEEILTQIAATRKHLWEEVAEIGKLLEGNQQAMSIFAKMNTLLKKSAAIRDQQIDLVRSNQFAEAEVLFRGDSFYYYEQVYKTTRELEALVEKENTALKAQSASVAYHSNISLILSGGLVLFLLIFIIWAIMRMINGVSRELKEGIQVLSTSSSEIQTTVSEISTGAAETATAISETTTTVEEIRQTSMLAGSKAKNLLATSQNAAEIGERGLETSDQMIKSMNKINVQMQAIQNTINKLSEQNRSIGDITSTVSDIADQSNLLAVNAAIEAAKAGEQGRGFTVVAQEIRNLSEQSKKSTAQVKEILSEVQKAVNQAVEVIRQGKDTADEGLRMVQEDRVVVENLMDSINEAMEASVQISSSSQQQMAGMDQIVPAMENIKQASDQNVVGIRQTNEAAKDLYELSVSLRQVIERYRL